MPGPLNVRGVRLGVPICEDIWNAEVVETLAETGAEILVSPNGSPFDWPKPDSRMNVAVARVTESGLPLAYLNQVGGQDELVFDGASFVLNSDRSLAVQLPAWREAVVVTDWTRTDVGWRCEAGEFAKLAEGPSAAYHACVLGLKDYVDQERLSRRRARALGRHQFRTRRRDGRRRAGTGARARRSCCRRSLPPTKASLDAAACAKALGIRYDKLSIEPAVAGLTWGLKDLFAGTNADITEENLQSRVRGTILMAISNKFGAMVVTTGNKSEMSVGYATLYGDMNGGFNPIKDLYKTEVYALARWRNAQCPGRRRSARGRRHSGTDPDQGADGGTARQSDRSGFAAALRRARRYPAIAWSKTNCRSPPSSRAAMRPRR